ncbi:MAG: alpha/beta hydrolase, partial [Pseudonocardiales bacterium]
MRANYPLIESFIERDGVKVGYEVFGTGEPTVVFVPISAIVHSGAWKAQVPYLARRCRVVTIDPRGNGRSDRPTDPTAYADTEFVEDTVAVMDTLGIDRAVLVGLCSSGWRALLAAATYPDRVLGVVSIATSAPFLTPPLPTRAAAADFDTELEVYEGWNKDNRHYWRQDWRGFAEFFFGELLVEPHSTKQREDCVAWAMEIGAETMIAHDQGPISSTSKEQTEAILGRVRCPVLEIHGEEDRCQPVARSLAVAELTAAQVLTLAGAGHLPQAREPVVINHAIRDFVSRFAPAQGPRRWTRPLHRRQRVLFLSSPIGLGHSRRDVAIADELRTLRPDVQVDWLAQHPLTELLERRGERIHPASAHLANESSHIESESAEHDLHAFQAIRRMDEILVNNFMVFADLVAEQPYDLWLGDEAWDIDFFLHENPELKRTAFVWMTDFVGWLPMPDGGAAEARLTADYNAEMIEQRARFRRVRDRSIFVGNPEDV